MIDQSAKSRNTTTGERKEHYQLNGKQQRYKCNDLID